MAWNFTLKGKMLLDTSEAEKKAQDASRRMTVPWKGGFTPSAGTLARNPELKKLLEEQGAGAGFNKGKLALGAGAGLFSPFVGARILSDLFKGAGGAGGGMAGAMFGGGGAGAYGALYMALTLLRKSLMFAAHVIESAVKTGFALYTGAAQSGLSTSFFAQRKMLASVLGVSGSPNQVFVFGKAVEEMTRKLKLAIDIISGNARQLAGVAMDWKVLGYNLSAIWSQLATSLSASMHEMIESVNSMILVALQTGVAKGFFDELNVVLKVFVVTLQVIDLSVSGLILLFRTLGDIITWVMGKIHDGLVAIHVIHGPKMNVPFISTDTEKASAEINKQWANLGKTILGKTEAPAAPSMMPFAKQLPVSSWEKMGLVMGGLQAGTVDYARRTALATEKIASQMGLGGGIPRGTQFGLSPNTGNP